VNRKTQLGFLAGLILCFGCAGNQHGEAQLKKGAAAPDFETVDKDGAAIKLSALQNEGPVVVSLLRSFL
jgi:hypothetical protein